MKIQIRTRLTLIYCAVFWLSFILLEIGAYAGLRASMYAVVDSELETRLGGVVGFLDEHVGRKTLAKLQSELSTHAALKPELLEVDQVGIGQIYQGRSMKDAARLRPATWAPVFLTTRIRQGPVRLLGARRKVKNREYDLMLGADYSGSTEILRRFGWLALLSSPLVFACGSLAGYSISKRALRPVSRLTNAACSIGAANLNERLAVPDGGDELQHLAETLNGMLDRIEGSFRHVTQFTANASHELRTPLALIRATSEVALLRTNGTVDHYREALHRVLREAEKNSILLDDMLRLARADASDNSLVLKPVEFEPHMKSLCERVLPLALEKGLRLERQVSEPGLWVMADPEHLKRLWLILLDNAIRYTPSGGTIRVSWQAVSAESLLCEVSDTGIGIADVDLPHIFQRFFRADKARSREEGGAGLGLALARWIADAHHATIDVESAPGQGSTFRVTLPMPTRAVIGTPSPDAVKAKEQGYDAAVRI